MLHGALKWCMRCNTGELWCMVNTVEDAKLGWFARSNCTVGALGVCGESAQAAQTVQWSSLCKIHEAKIHFAFCLNTLLHLKSKQHPPQLMLLCGDVKLSCFLPLGGSQSN